MTYLPIQEPPNIEFGRKGSVITVPNVISKDLANSLIEYAMGPKSGLHRRGSKSSGIIADFSTCLIPLGNPIYDILAPVWKQVKGIVNPPLSFIELYELKIYNVDDRFDWHQDNKESVECNIGRKFNMIVQLSEESDYVGGDLMLGEHYCARQFGTALLFPAYHIHRVTPIKSGTRMSLIGHAWGPLY